MCATPRGSEGTDERLSWRERWVTRDRLVLGVVAFAMWTVCVVITVYLCVTYTESSRKEKTALDNVRFEAVETPSVIVLSRIGARCGVAMSGCFFLHFRPTSHGGVVERNCTSIVTQRSTSLYGEFSEAHILNQTEARREGFVFRTLLDYIAVDFEVVRYNNDNTTTPVTNASECGQDWQGRRQIPTNAMLVPIADQKFLDEDNRDPRLDTTNLGTPVYAGLNHQSLLSFRLSQEHFVDGRMLSKVSFKNTQLNLANNPKNVVFSISVQPDSFEVQQIKRIAGESLFTLMGAVFGWVSALTGASIQGLLVASYFVHQRHLSRKRSSKAAEQEPKRTSSEPSDHNSYGTRGGAAVRAPPSDRTPTGPV